MNKTESLKHGDILISFEKGFAQEIPITEEKGTLYMEAEGIRQKIKDYDFKGCHLLISNDKEV